MLSKESCCAATIIGVNLAKDAIQVCVVKHTKALSHTEMTPDEFSAWLATQRPAMIVFEAYGTSKLLEAESHWLWSSK